MKKPFIFDKIISRENTLSVKYDRRGTLFGNAKALPLWIADMDFPTAPFILSALSKRIEHGILGYTLFSDSLREAFQKWTQEEHRWKIEKEWICFAPAVIPALSILIRELTLPGDTISYLSPSYPPFFNSIKENGRKIAPSSLDFDGKSFHINFEDLEKKIAISKAFIFCNPHNPTGRVWTPQECSSLAKLCQKYGTFVISDEIHWDIIYEGAEFTSFASLFPENTIHLTSPGKTFNLPGMPVAFCTIANPQKREKYMKALRALHLDDGNCMALIAAEAAYGGGKSWLQELLKYLKENLDYLDQELKRKTPAIRLVYPEGTFIPLLHFGGVDLSHGIIAQKLIHEAGVLLNDGLSFGKEGEKFFRINVATPRQNLQNAVKAIIRVFS